MHCGLRRLALAACVVLATLVADAVAAPPGSKNFTAPSYVPNYFSNEAGSFRGEATARPAQPGAAPTLAAPPPRTIVAAASRRAGRHHVGRAAKARGHIRLARGKAGGHRQLVHARTGRAQLGQARTAARARAAGPRLAHAQHGPARSKAVAVKSRPAPGKGRGAAHGRG
jgi:hypothetical protein